VETSADLTVLSAASYNLKNGVPEEKRREKRLKLAAIAPDGIRGGDGEPQLLGERICG